MSKIHGRASAYGAACVAYAEATKSLKAIRESMYEAEGVLNKAEMERNRTQRELLEEAQLT